MNILYISPYRNINHHHQCLNNIQTLSKFSSLTIYPIYIDSEIIEPDQSIIPLELKNVCSNEYDIVIQHAPIEYLIPLFSNIVKKNYCIPIIRYSKNKKLDQMHKLLKFDMVLFDSKYDADYICDNTPIKSKKIKLFNYNNSYHQNEIINLYHHNQNYKFYTFVNNETIKNINNILLAFFLTYQDIFDCSLIFITETDEISTKTKAIIDNFVNKNKISNIKNHIRLLPVPSNINNILAIHKTFDCYIEFRNTTNTHFNSFLAKENNNSFIMNENLDIFYEPDMQNNFELHPTFSISSLANKMKNIVRTKTIVKIDNIPTLDKIICK